MSRPNEFKEHRFVYRGLLDRRMGHLGNCSWTVGIRRTPGSSHLGTGDTTDLGRWNISSLQTRDCGRTAAILASLTSSCRRHDVDPQFYLTQLLVNLPSLRISDLPDWLPDRWKAAQNVRLAGFTHERKFAQ